MELPGKGFVISIAPTTDTGNGAAGNPALLQAPLISPAEKVVPS
jgi:hypothetical protein